MTSSTTPARRLSGVLLALLLLLGLSACGSDDSSDSSSSDTTATDSGSGADTTDTTATADTGGDPTAPVIENFTFTPDPIEISQGDTVTWTNNDDFAHTVTADDDSFDSGNIDGGATFEQTFDETGDFTYHCAIHNQMTGSVTVS